MADLVYKGDLVFDEDEKIVPKETKSRENLAKVYK